jgi:hypothetical protein
MAIAITAGTTMGTSVGSVDDYQGIDALGGNCTGFSNPGGDVVYKVTVPAGQRLNAKVTPATGTGMLPDGGLLQYDPSIYLVPTPASSCSMSAADGGTDLTCLAGADTNPSSDPAQPETVGWVNTSNAPVDVFIIIDSGWSANAMTDGILNTGAFTLDVSFSTPPPGDTCTAALALTAGTPLTAQVIDTYSDDYSSGSNCVFSSGPDRAYTLAVPPGMQAVITATPNSTLDVAISVADSVASCGVSCIASADVGYEGDPEVASWTNTGTSTVTVLVVVEAYLTSTGTFDLNAIIRAPPADDVCGGATVLTANTTVPGTTAGYSNDYDPGADSSSVNCSFFTSGPDRVYALTVPNGQRATVVMTDPSDGGFQPSLSFVAAPATNCGAMPLVCVASADSPPGRLFNVSGADQQYYAIVDGLGSGDYAISFTSAVPPTDDTCTSATTTLVSGVTLSNQVIAGFTQDYGLTSVPGCFGTFGADRVYKVSVPTGERVATTVTPTVQADGGALNVVVELVPAPASNCDGPSASCAAAADVGSDGDPETATYINQSASTQDVYVIVSNYHSPGLTTGDGFSVLATVAPAPSGDACFNAKTLTAGTLMNESLAGLSREYPQLSNATSCTSYDGADRVYSVTLAANQTLTAVATPVSTDGGAAGDLALNVLDGPASACFGATACLASSTGATAQTVTWQNASGATKTVFLVVGNGSVAINAAPAYNLTTTIQ